jgi:hypothetical protein
MKPGDEELARLEKLLGSVRFEPRASLGAELQGRWRRGERGPEHAVHNLRRILGIGGAGLLVGLGLFVCWVLALRPLGGTTVDRCCQDLDGGGLADDGLVVTAARGEEVKRLAIYEDRDGSRSFSAGDTLRFMRNGAPSVSAPVAAGARTIEFCCLDYDGGGPSDDALLVVGQPPDRITMAAIYERRAHSTLPFPLR